MRPNGTGCPNQPPCARPAFRTTSSTSLRYVARLSQPQNFDLNHPRYGLFRVGIQHVRGHLRQLVGGHRTAVGEGRVAVSARSPGTGLLRGDGDHRRDGRVLFPKDGAPSMSDGGQVATRTLTTACRRDGVTIRIGHRVQKVIRNDKGELIGVEARKRMTA